MPTPAQDQLSTPPLSVPLTPPPESRLSQEQQERSTECWQLVEDGISVAQGNNTASGMSFMQEQSLYQHHEESAFELESRESAAQIPKENDRDKIANSLDFATPPRDATETPIKIETPPTATSGDLDSAMPTPTSMMHETGDSNKHANEGDEMDINQDADNEDEFEGDDNGDIADSQDLQEPETSSQRSPHSIDSFGGPQSSSSSTPRWDFSNIRLIPQYPSSFLRPGTRFTGTQQSDRQIYNVDVNILTLSIPESTLTGYLRICGLTPDHPTLTTFFTGEIIGGPHQKYTFQTKHPGWGATDKTDLQHWARFPAWRPLKNEAKRDINFAYPAPSTGLATPASTGSKPEGQGWWQRENVFMRWKEWFLVPDHRVRSIQGASFEGFYYICFNQVEGKVSGIYFHARSEKYQQLELKHVPDKGVCGAMEFC